VTPSSNQHLLGCHWAATSVGPDTTATRSPLKLICLCHPVMGPRPPRLLMPPRQGYQVAGLLPMEVQEDLLEEVTTK
jgi:hypothetical protein